MFNNHKNLDLGGLENILDLFDALNSDTDESFDDEEKMHWKPFRSFFISMKALIELDFSEQAKMFAPFGIRAQNLAQEVPSIFARLKKFDPIINELKVWKGEEEIISEAESLNEKIMSLKNFDMLGPLIGSTVKPLIDQIFGMGFPLVPFPSIQRCLGLS